MPDNENVQIIQDSKMCLIAEHSNIYKQLFMKSKFDFEYNVYNIGMIPLQPLP